MPANPTRSARNRTASLPCGHTHSSIGMPIATSRISSGKPSRHSSRGPETMRLVGVPMSVVVPPRMEPKASGSGRSSRVASCIATGISSAARVVSMRIDSVGPALAGSTRRVSASTAPDVCRPWLSTSTQATVTTAGWAKPAKALPYGTRPVNTQASSAAAATMSWRQRPHKNRPTVAHRMPTMSNCSGRMPCLPQIPIPLRLKHTGEPARALHAAFAAGR